MLTMAKITMATYSQNTQSFKYNTKIKQITYFDGLWMCLSTYSSGIQ